AGLCRMATGRDQPKSRRTGSLGITFSHGTVVKIRVHFSAGLEQKFGDLGRVFWGFLAIGLDHIGADIVQEHSAMLARGARPNEFWIAAKQSLEGSEIAIDYGIHGRLELRNRR